MRNARGCGSQQLFWAGLATCSYLPATVFPTGPGLQNLPIGLQAIRDAYADLQTIEFTRLVTQEFGVPAAARRELNAP